MKRKIFCTNCGRKLVLGEDASVSDGYDPFTGTKLATDKLKHWLCPVYLDNNLDDRSEAAKSNGIPRGFGHISEAELIV